MTRCHDHFEGSKLGAEIENEAWRGGNLSREDAQGRLVQIL